MPPVFFFFFFLPSNLNYRVVAVVAAAVTAAVVVVAAVVVFFLWSPSRRVFYFIYFFHFPPRPAATEVFAVVVFVVPRCTRLITEPHQRSQSDGVRDGLENPPPGNIDTTDVKTVSALAQNGYFAHTRGHGACGDEGLFSCSYSSIFFFLLHGATIREQRKSIISSYIYRIEVAAYIVSTIFSWKK